MSSIERVCAVSLLLAPVEYTSVRVEDGEKHGTLWKANANWKNT